MVFSNTVPSHLSTLSLQQALDLANLYLHNAYSIHDHKLALVLCHDAEVALSQAKKANKKYPAHPDDARYQAIREGVAMAYVDLGKYLDRRGYPTEAMALCRKAEKWGGKPDDPGRLALQSRPTSMVQPSNDSPPPVDSSPQDVGPAHASRVNNIRQQPQAAVIPHHIFADNVRPPAVVYKLPQPDERLSNTPQLVCCLSLLQVSHSPNVILDPAAHNWLQAVERDADEQERLHALSTQVVRAFMKDELKDAKAVAEVVCLAPALTKEAFHDLIREFHTRISQSAILNFQLLEGIAQLIQGADSGYLGSDDLVKILQLFSTRLIDTHQQSAQHMHQLTLAVSHVLDAMADTKVTGIDRVRLHEPLSAYLNRLKESKDPFLVYQAAYAYQALLCIPDNETTWQAAMRRTGRVVQGVAGLVTAAKGLDLEKFINGLADIQQGLGGVVNAVKTGYDGIALLAKNGQGFVDCLKEGLSFSRQRDWYSALRGTDILIRDGEFLAFKTLVCRAPCQRDPAFQWGVCQRLGEIAANPMWDPVTRKSAIEFLGEIYRDDETWGQHASVKQWILNILMELASGSGTSGSSGGIAKLHSIVTATLLQELQKTEDPKKQELYRQCRENGPIAYPLKIALPELGSPSLLDRVQNRPDVEGNIRVLRKQRTKERGNAVYIPPQAKPNLQAPDEARFPLMERAKVFLESEQKVFLLLGDSGAGKSTFSRELEYGLWKEYERKKDRIPLHINLPAIEKPEHDMIAKQLRKAEFTEPQIREMKHHRRFILICDGYDESQQTHNLYVTNKLNQPGEWDAQMVISCRSEYLGPDYRDRFQPGGDRNTRSDSSLFQEAMIVPFTVEQVRDYIQQYVSIHQPLWRIEEYEQALELIPSLKDLVKNPFLMTLSLDVLPRMVDLGENLSTARVTRVALYDHFVEQWLEREKKRLGEKDMSRQTKAAFERLNAGGFTLNGIECLKQLAVAIYKEQDGHPVIEYSPLIDEGSWKDDFFKEEHKQLLLEACPLRRNGNQHRFIHRSLLEYGLARAVFDPQDRRNRDLSEPRLGQRRRRRRGSSSSTLSFETEDTSKKRSSVAELETKVDPDSPLAWRSFVSDHSLLQFLEERVLQEPVFRQQLRLYVELSKSDKKWRKAASNAITILVRSGVLFNGADLRGIQIPGADLSYGAFDSAQFQGADLRKVVFRGNWMPKADFTGAQMDGAQFGELPYLSEDIYVSSCAYSPDGRLFAVGLMSGIISMYSTSNWEKVMTLVGYRAQVQRIAFSPDGDQIASVSNNRTARLWDVESGKCRIILIHTDHVNCVAYSPQASQIAIGGNDKALRLRDAITGDCLRTLSGHSSGVYCAAYSPQGNKIVTGSDDTVQLWDVETGTCILIMIGHVDRVWGIAYSPRGDQIASSSNDDTVRLWDVETGLCRHVFQHSHDVYSVAYSPKGGQLASGSDDGAVRIWDVETGSNRHTFTGHGSRVRCVAYSPQGHHVASGSLDRTVRLWDVSSGVSRFVPSSRHSGTFMVTCSPNGDQFASYRSGNTIRLLDLETGACQRTLSGHSDMIVSVAYSPQGERMVSCDRNRSVLLWNLESGTFQHLFTAKTSWNGYPCLAFSPQGHMIASVFGDRRVYLWDIAAGDFKIILIGQTGRVVSIAFSPNGKWIASGSWDGTVWIRDTASFTRRHVLECNSKVSDVVFSPQGHQLASVSEDTAVRLWDVTSGECQMILMGHTEGFVAIMYSLNGDTLVSGTRKDNVIRLWDVATGQCRAVIRDLRGTLQGFRGFSRGIGSEDIYVAVEVRRETNVWKIVEEKDRCRVSPHLIVTHGALNVIKASIQGVRGLSQLNHQLLKQRGAEGEPELQMREESRKMMAMASVVSKLTRPIERSMMDAASMIDVPEEQVERSVEQLSDS